MTGTVAHHTGGAMRGCLGLFGAAAGATVVTLTARYGAAAADNPADAAIGAFFFGSIAVGAIAGPAAATHLWRTSRVWGAIVGAVSAAALCVNLSNSLGAIAGRADAKLAARQAAVQAVADARGELARLTAERQAMPVFAPTPAFAVIEAQNAVRAAAEARTAECTVRGRFCRERETAEARAREALAAAANANGLTDRAAAIEKRMGELRAKIEAVPHVVSADPQAEMLARVFGVDTAAASTGQKVAMVVTVELLIAAALLAWELLGHGGQPKSGTGGTPAPQAATVPASAPEVKSIPAPPKQPIQKSIRNEQSSRICAAYITARIRPARGETLLFSDALADAARWAADEGHPAPSANALSRAIGKALRKAGGKRVQVRGRAAFKGLRLEAAAPARVSAGLAAKVNGCVNGAAAP